MYEFEIASAAYEMLKALDIKAAESVAITADTEADQVIVDAFCKACVAVDAKPLMLKYPTPAKIEDLPGKALTATIRGCEAWIEVNNQKINGTCIYDAIMDGKEIKYACVGGLTRETLVQEIVRTGKVDLESYKTRR